MSQDMTTTPPHVTFAGLEWIPCSLAEAERRVHRTGQAAPIVVAIDVQVPPDHAGVASRP